MEEKVSKENKALAEHGQNFLPAIPAPRKPFGVEDALAYIEGSVLGPLPLGCSRASLEDYDE